jgi:hypothetical protein
MELRPSLDSVIMDYVHFVGSSSGMAVLFVNFIGRVQQDVAAFSARSWGAVLFAVSTYAGWRLWSTKKTGEDAAEHWEVLRAHAVPLLALCGFWGFFLAARYSAVSKAYLALGLLLSCCAIAMKYKLWMPLSLFLAYSAACTFLTILGLAGYQRIALTFSFLFHIGAVLLIIRPFETTHESQERVSPHASSRLAWSVLFVVAGLYTCWAWWPSDWRTQFSHEVEGRDAAIKVSDDRALDRSLYFTGRHALVYTFSDTLPVGSVRRYIRLRDPTRSWNESFTHPNGFLEDEKDQ